jgi:hypothetical protein
MNNRKYKQIYWKGDLAEYTGNSEVLHGELFHEYLLLEGHRKGEKIWSPRACEYISCQPA